MNPEIGRELEASELKPKTVVVLMKQGRPSFTAWVDQVFPDAVMFFAGKTGMRLLLKREGEQLFDDTPARITLREFLGDVEATQ